MLELKVHRQVVDKSRWKIGSHEHKLKLTKIDKCLSVATAFKLADVGYLAVETGPSYSESPGEAEGRSKGRWSHCRLGLLPHTNKVS